MGMQRFTYYYKKFVYTRISFFVMCVFCVLNGSIYAQTADFTADTTKGCVPMQVSFTDLSSGNPVAWEWIWVMVHRIFIFKILLCLQSSARMM